MTALPVLGLLAAMTSIQAGASLAKRLFPVAGPAGTTALRLILASLMLCAVWRPWRTKLDKKALRAVALYGAALGLMNLTFYLALQRLPLGITVAIEFTGPLAVALLSSHKPLDFVWAALAAAGIWLILPVTASQAPLDPLGIALALAAATCWALYIVFGQTASNVAPSGVVTSLGMTAAAIVGAPLGLATTGRALLSPRVFALGLAVAVLSSALPYSLEMAALKRLPAKTFSIMMSLEPALAALMGTAMLGELLTARQWTAIGCVIAASFGTALTAGTKVPIPPEP